MCLTCGCGLTPAQRETNKTAVTVLQSLLSANDQQAAHNREHFDSYGVFAVNLMSSPGAGKTALLEATIEALRNEFAMAVIEGDLATENDADRIRAKGMPAVQICTGSACHLDAQMVHDALHQLELQAFDIVFIENVGNLVCPASFDLGHHRNVTLLAVTEGDDKPAKYPVMFRAADLVLLTKTDLLPVLDDFDPARAKKFLRGLASAAPMHEISARKNLGMEEWLDWLRLQVTQQRERVLRGETARPAVQADGARLHGMAAEHSHPPRFERVL
jgi:hydrogenase nickel incorporation protein HypB